MKYASKFKLNPFKPISIDIILNGYQRITHSFKGIYFYIRYYMRYDILYMIFLYDNDNYWQLI